MKQNTNNKSITVMKTKTFSMVLTIAMIFAGSLVVKASDNDSTTVEKKIIKIVKSDDKGTVVIDSTITTANGKTVVHVDTTSFDSPDHFGGPRHKFRGKRMEFQKDGRDENYEIEVQTEGDSTHVMVNGEPMDEMFDMMPGFDSAPCHKRMIMMNHEEGMPVPPAPPVPPCHFNGQHSQGMIDLNDPSIISFEKKIQKDGTEKITIVRKLE
jgi:hypothetical protein